MWSWPRELVAAVTDDELSSEGTPAPADVSAAARTIIGGDRQVDGRRQEPELQLQWNVPVGVTPHIPLWLAGLFFGSIALVALFALVGRFTQPGACEAALAWHEALGHEGRIATFAGVATPLGPPSTPDVTLEIGERPGLVVVIPDDVVYRFGEDVREAYSGQAVAVTGRVQAAIGGYARITVTRPENLVRCG